MHATRCAARRDFTATAELCHERDDCERFRQFTLHGPGAQAAPLWLCASPAFEARIPRPCAGRGSRLNPTRPNAICRGATGIAPCTRWQYAAQDGITPDFSDNGGGATCVDKVVRLEHGQTNVGDGERLRAPAR